jgi:predicted ATPase
LKENAIHPAKTLGLVEQLKEMVVDTTFEPSFEDDNLMRQIIIATHSPHLVQLLEPSDLLIPRQSIVRNGN